MRVTIKGKGDVTLTQQDFVAEGGQGKVYAKGDTAFKIYHNPADMIPEGKIRELAPLPVPPFSRPMDLLLDRNAQVIGYTTRFVQDAYVLCQVFPRSFRDREGVTHKHTFHLAELIRDGMGVAHKAGIILVDPNEMNFLVDTKFREVAFIDTDSYKTRSYPATAIMESIRDRHMKDPMAFDEGTDWFSFACVAFQLLTGIHPYKGKHPSLKGFEERMKANVSVLHRDVRVPKVAYPFSVIPKDWMAWFEAVLERGERCPPPGGTLVVGVIKPVVKAITGALNLILEEIGSFDGDVSGVWCSGNTVAVATNKGLWLDGHRVSGWKDAHGVAFSPRYNTVVAMRHQDTVPEFQVPRTMSALKFGMAAQRAAQHDGRIYIKNRGQVLEVLMTDLGTNNVMLSTSPVANVLPNASMLFPGGVYQNMLGSAFVSIFAGPGKSHQVRIKDLDAYRVLDAKWDQGAKGGVLMVIGRKKGGQHDRLVFRFDPTFSVYDVRKVEDVGQAGLNFVVTDAGVCVCLDEEDKIELSSTRKGSTQMKTVTDRVLGGDMRLYKRGAQVLVAKGGKLYTMRMK